MLIGSPNRLPCIAQGLVSSPSTSQTSTWVVALGVQPITATTASEGDSSGFSTNTANLNAVVTSLLLSLQDFGEIVEHRLGTGNWLFIRSVRTLCHVVGSIHVHAYTFLKIVMCC